MFDKTDKIVVTSDMYESELPDNLNNKEHDAILSLLLNLTQSIASKFDIQTVNGQFDRIKSDKIEVWMTNNGSRIVNGVSEKENKRAIEFLQSFDGVLTTKQGMYNYLNSSLVTLDTAQLNPMLEALNLLKDPPKSTEPTIRAMC